jgi:hypothetical protein
MISVSGYKYCLVIVDDFSHYSWTFPLRLKSNIFTTIFHFFAMVSTQFGRTIRAVQCDNEREFDKSTSLSFLLLTVFGFACLAPTLLPRMARLSA